MLQIYNKTIASSSGSSTITDVASLPSSDITTGIFYRLTSADDTLKASPGYYTYDGTSWQCTSCTEAYALGNLGATPTLTLISGMLYTWTVNAVVSDATITISRPGLPSVFVSSNPDGNNFLVADITATGRTLKSVGWDDDIVNVLGCTGSILDDGTNLILVSGAFDA